MRKRKINEEFIKPKFDKEKQAKISEELSKGKR